MGLMSSLWHVDFCLWAPPKLDTISDTEGEEVAYCTKKGHGTRIIPEGTLLGAQLLKTNDYWMITGLIDQSRINIPSDDFGGELDSGGQDGVRTSSMLLLCRHAKAFHVYSKVTPSVVCSTPPRSPATLPRSTGGPSEYIGPFTSLPF